MKNYLIIFFMFLLSTIDAQEQLKGVILESGSSKEMPLPGANIYWLGSTIGTISTDDGTFSLPYKFS
ncbi:hypothetical protein, partial [Winogradskyella sp.]|uniref:hypothetical protein n=1 Tax=Winogradskyella sp. TaxID=1883156 RepID=UPI0025CDB7E0